MNLSVSSEIGDYREMSATSFNLTGKRLLAGVAVHVSLQRTGASEPLVANLTLVLLLSTGRHFGAELSHHRLRGRGDLRAHQALGSRQSP